MTLPVREPFIPSVLWHIIAISSSFVSSNRILPFVYTFSGIFVELLKVIQSAGMC